MTSFVMLVGIPASGKTDYAMGLKQKGYKIHSSNALREELFGDESVQKDNSLVFNELHRRIIRDLKNGEDCVYDATNISSNKRKHFIKQIGKIKCYKIAVLFSVPFDVCMTRNEQRGRHVPVDVIRKMYKNFQIPYYNEGWDDIQIMFDDVLDDRWDANRVLDVLDYYDQKNSHHSLTLGKHMEKCMSNLVGLSSNISLCRAGMYHDIGKPFCASFYNRNGEKDEDCHYYNHENVSSYDYLLYWGYRKKDSSYFEEEKNSALYTAFLILNHMRPYTWKFEKTFDKYKKLWGEKIYNDVMLLHECDKASH